ncbi:hypothetical protein [Gimesia sp.]|uniref:hypothetical protein n=1 Tax=Gimesia sp. TaxID=2024833 RepID=UPI000C688B3F|nr:hypothetical protein [Gimesia sp.]MAX35531.1 hypothetical protein [Gimesia sp.]HAH48785.1 hypothetical protein [Planctomycetaceae bacterium]HBL42679.1 hypothetical protein [Planctomycetaceae bacterium]|tara:strand:- start:4308 stop:4637 length:330 start_codon:yes stop_codon:yes gene_type:complete
MKRLFACCLMLTVSIAYSLAAEPKAEQETPRQVYKVLARLEIDKLGLDGKLPPNNSYEPSLERGLNILAARGWELVAVEGGRMRTFNGGGDASLDIHPTYIFRKMTNGK